MNMPKSRDIQAKMPSPKVILNAFWPVTVKALNSYSKRKIKRNPKIQIPEKGSVSFFTILIRQIKQSQ